MPINNWGELSKDYNDHFTRKMVSKDGSTFLKTIFEKSGLTKVASNELPGKKGHKWIICCNNCKKPVTPKQALKVLLSKKKKLNFGSIEVMNFKILRINNLHI